MLFYLLCFVVVAKSFGQGAFINSFNGNVIGGSGVVCVNNVCYSSNGNGAFISAGTGCNVINGKIYKDGVYLRDMTPADYARLSAYMQEVNQWSFDFQDSLQRSFPWDPRNPAHTQFPWNMMHGAWRSKRRARSPKRQRTKRYMPFPVVPYFC